MHNQSRQGRYKQEPGMEMPGSYGQPDPVSPARDGTIEFSCNDEAEAEINILCRPSRDSSILSLSCFPAFPCRALVCTVPDGTGLHLQPRSHTASLALNR